MSEPVEVVIAATSHAWAAQLTEWITDHGDGVRLRNHFLFDRSDALHLPYDCLVIEAESSLLDEALVEELRRRHRCIVGVFHPDEPAGRQRLGDLGVDWIVAATDPPQDILDAATQVASNEQRFRDAVTDLASPATIPQSATQETRPEHAAGSVLTVVTGALEGVGSTEVAIEVTAQLRRRGETAVLVDGDLIAPNLAQRLQTPITANLFAAIDAVRHTLTDPTAALTPIPPAGFELLGGVEHPKHWQDLDPDDLLAVLDTLRARRQHVVVNVGSQLEALPCGRHETARAIVRAADRILVVTDPTPAGLVRLSRWTVDARELTESGRINVVVNRSDLRDTRPQFEEELLRTVECAGVSHVPSDRRLSRAVWAGLLPAPGKFTKAVAALTRRAVPHTAAAGETRRMTGSSR